MAETILVLGGGASGIAAAVAAAQEARAAQSAVRVVLVEKNPRVGKKLLATGNGRCNLDNKNAGADKYLSDAPAQQERMLAAIAKADPLRWFEEHGLLYRTTEDGRVYPYSNQASDVLALLLFWLEKTGVEVLTGSAVCDIDRKGAHYRVRLEDGRQLYGAAVIAALGGYAGPQFGTDGFGMKLAQMCGCRLTPVYPCLVPVRCEKAQVSGLAGVRVAARVRLYAGAECLGEESGEVQFTEYGLSGIAVMQLSGLLPRAGRQARLELDLFDGQTAKALAAELRRRAAQMPGCTMEQYMTGLVHKRIGAAVWKRASLGPMSLPARQLTEMQWMTLARGFKEWRFTGLQAAGWQQAQTTGGGVCLTQVAADSFMLRECPGLYMVGETLDCAGQCGGYNLHWAFGSGLLAGRHAVHFCTRSRR